MTLTIQRPVSNEFTLEVWIKLHTAGVVNDNISLTTPIYDNTYNHGDHDFSLYIDGITPVLSISGHRSAESTQNMVTGQWTHIAAVRDRNSNEARIYINGQLFITGDSRTTLFDHEDRIWIGRNMRTAYLGYEVRLNAYIDECRIWNKPLTAAEIQNNMNRELAGTEAGLVTYLNFNDETFEDLTSVSNHGTAFGSPTFIEEEIFNTETNDQPSNSRFYRLVSTDGPRSVSLVGNGVLSWSEGTSQGILLEYTDSLEIPQKWNTFQRIPDSDKSRTLTGC